MGQKVHPLGFRLSISQDHQSQWYANTTDYSIYVLEDNFIRQRLQQKFSDAGIVKIHIERKIDLIKISMVATQPRAFSAFSLLNKNTNTVKQNKNLTNKNDNGAQQEGYAKSDAPSSSEGVSLSTPKGPNSSGARYATQKQTSPFIQDQQTNPLNLLSNDLTYAIIAYRKKTFAFQKPRTLRNTLFFGRPAVEIYIEKLTEPYTSAVFIGDAIALEIEKRIPFRRAMKFAVQRAQKAGVLGIKVQISGRLNGAEIARTEWVRKGRIPLHTLRAKIDYTCQTAKTIYGIIGIKVWVFQGMAG